MLQELTLSVKNIKNKQAKNEFEACLEILDGVESADLDLRSGKCAVAYEDRVASAGSIIAAAVKEGYRVERAAGEAIFYVEGMHCPSCEVLIEKKLLQEQNIEAVDVSVNRNWVVIEYSGSTPTVKKLNAAFKEDGYRFSEKPAAGRKKLFEYNDNGQLLVDKERLSDLLYIVGFSLLFMIGFLFLHKSGLSALISVNAASALPMFIVFGLLAGFSSCAALVGGIILSMSKQWLDNYTTTDSTFVRLQPHLLFNAGRLASYAGLGFLLGLIGNVLQLSLSVTAVMVIGVSVMMVFLGLQMLGIKYFHKFRIALPRFITRRIADESNFQGKYMPLVMGALTFFLPCGFTITAQGLALASGDPVQASLIMLFFALGTMPALLAIGLSSVVLSGRGRGSHRFMRVAGVLVLFFAVFNINSQLNVLGLKSLSDLSLLSSEPATAAENGLPPMVNGKQIIRMDALAYGYEPNQFKVRAGVPVRWEITDQGTSGCTNAVMSKGLFEGQIELTPGKTSVKEFTPGEPGRYKFSCWMGMISGSIDVVEVNDDGTTRPIKNKVKAVPSGASGCGCGSGGGGTCGAR